MSEGERETLVIALDHAWRWYENRRSRAMTLLQMLFGWLAICGAAYGVSIQADEFGLGGVVCLAAAAGVIGYDVDSARLRASAQLAAEAVAEMQGRLADALSMETLRLHQRESAHHASPRRLLGHELERWMTALSVIVSFAAAFYTWFVLA
ncbi:hypothetical protein [Streptomyces sp. enrichment culture]|uniref:hypothetical protein n=1 Tax=Streptomyces sp. enrichment culture TaxID=1795815 RepID=UPI003F56ED92